jgi:hypothetical protein
MATEQMGDVSTEGTVRQKDTRPRLDSYFWAGALIWAGLVFGAESLGMLPQIGNAGAWSWVFAGAGIGGLLLSLYSLSSPDYATPTTWDYFWSGLLLIIGLGGLTTIDISWPLILILIGVVSLANVFLRRE